MVDECLQLYMGFYQTYVISVSVTDNQEYVADLVEKYDFLALPVVDEQHKLCGIITIDDVIDIIKDQASEDIYAMAGLTQNDMMFDKSPPSTT